VKWTRRIVGDLDGFKGVSGRRDDLHVARLRPTGRDLRNIGIFASNRMPNGATRGRRAGARGFLALDGTKLQADASSFQNYDRDRLEKAIGELEKQLQQMLVEAAGQDAAEDAAEQDRDDSATPS
jgi:hypothetical protein